MTLRLAFMGTPEFAVPSLAEILNAGHDVACVYTQPPARAGRGKSLRKSHVHQFADIMGLTVRSPKSFRSSSVIDDFAALDLDAACVVAYGQILPIRALEAPRLGCLNLHGSMLPRWRGAAPIHRAILAGDKNTAAQIMQMEAGLDTGSILLSETIEIKMQDTAGSLHDRMASIGAGLWPRALAALERGGLTPTPQSGTPTYAKKIEKSETRIDWQQSSIAIANQIRGFSPWPGAWCELPTRRSNERVKVHMAVAETTHQNSEGVKPGTVLDDELLIACAQGAVRLTRLQPGGKKVMGAEEYLRGRPCPAATILT